MEGVGPPMGLGLRPLKLYRFSSEVAGESPPWTWTPPERKNTVLEKIWCEKAKRQLKSAEEAEIRLIKQKGAEH